MIKEILQENNNRSLSKGKLNQKQSNSIINGFSVLKKLNLIKKSKYGNTLKNKNLQLLLNRNENIYSKKITNLKTTSFNKVKKEKSDFIFERNDILKLDKNINYTSRECLKNNHILNEETKMENSFNKNRYYSNRVNSNDYINNLDKEFEIRCLNKKLEKLRQKNIEIKDDLNKLKKQNFSLKNGEITESNIKNNIFYSLQNIYQFIFHKEKKTNLKSMLLDLMDLKYNYENTYLINIFYQNLEQLIQITEAYDDKENIYSNIENIFRAKDKIIQEIEKLNDYQRKNQKYFEFCELLFQNFETKDLDYIYNYLIKIESNNEKEIRKIIKMRNILFSNIDSNNNNKISNANISLEKFKRNKSQYLNYFDLQNINKNYKKINKSNNGYLTERNKSVNNKNSIISLKNQANNYNFVNNKIDKEKINNFLYSTKGYKLSTFSNENKEISYNYNNYNENNYSKNKKPRINLNTISTNITQVNNTQTQNYICSLNNENENVLNFIAHKKINYNDDIKNKKNHSRIPSLKKIKNYHPIYYK